MNKAISWYALWKRLGKQPLKVTRGRYVKVYKDGIMWNCKLIYTQNGSDFYLEPIKIAEKEK